MLARGLGCAAWCHRVAACCRHVVDLGPAALHPVQGEGKNVLTNVEVFGKTPTSQGSLKTSGAAGGAGGAKVTSIGQVLTDANSASSAGTRPLRWRGTPARAFSLRVGPPARALTPTAAPARRLHQPSRRRPRLLHRGQHPGVGQVQVRHLHLPVHHRRHQQHRWVAVAVWAAPRGRTHHHHTQLPAPTRADPPTNCARPPQACKARWRAWRGPTWLTCWPRLCPLWPMRTCRPPAPPPSP